MARKRKTSRLLSIFLIRAKRTKPQQIFRNLSGLREYGVRIGRKKLGALYVQPSIVHTPRWASFFQGVLDIKSLGIRTASAAAVLLVPHEGRLFALAFGQGRHLLLRSSYEEDFGLLTTLNAVDRNRIREIDRRRFDAISRLTREQAIRDVPIFDFGLEPEHELLRSLTGSPSDASLGKRLSGRDSLAASVRLELSDLETQLNLYLQKARGKGYKKKFPGINAIGELRDQATRRELDDELLRRLTAHNLDRIWMAVPDLINWTDVEFCYRRSDAPEVHGDLDLMTYLQQLRRPGSFSVGTLKHHHILCLSASTDTVIHEWPAYQCIYAEIERPDGTFILESGKWYRIDQDLVANVNREVGRIRSTSLTLPPYRDGEDEEDYNRRFASLGTEYALMDGENLSYGGGHSQVEFCDIFSTSGILLHVKRYRGSGVLSHLFSQGVIAASLFLGDDGFRQVLNTKLPATHRLKNHTARPNPTEYEIAFAIARLSEGDLTLPFFSRVTLRNAYRELTNFGFKVTCSKIEVEAIKASAPRPTQRSRRRKSRGH